MINAAIMLSMINSRLSHKYLPSVDGAYREFHDYLRGD